MFVTTLRQSSVRSLFWLAAFVVVAGLIGLQTPVYANAHHGHPAHHHKKWVASRHHAKHRSVHHGSAVPGGLFKGIHLSPAQAQVVQAMFSQYRQQRASWMRAHGKQLHELAVQTHTHHRNPKAMRAKWRKLMASQPSFEKVVGQVKTVVLKKNQVRRFERNLAQVRKAWRHAQAEHRAAAAERMREHQQAAHWQKQLDQMFAHVQLSPMQSRQIRLTLQKARMQAIAKIRHQVLTDHQNAQVAKNLKRLHAQEVRAHHKAHRKAHRHTSKKTRKGTKRDHHKKWHHHHHDRHD